MKEKKTHTYLARDNNKLLSSKKLASVINRKGNNTSLTRATVTYIVKSVKFNNITNKITHIPCSCERALYIDLGLLG